ncbi:hypothetical protein, partial [Herbiconiux daphne]
RICFIATERKARGVIKPLSTLYRTAKSIHESLSLKNWQVFYDSIFRVIHPWGMNRVEVQAGSLLQPFPSIQRNGSRFSGSLMVSR